MENTDTQLTITDIAMTRDVIDLACKRGAFSGAEAKQVGTLFEKLDHPHQFLKKFHFFCLATLQQQINLDRPAILIV